MFKTILGSLCRNIVRQCGIAVNNPFAILLPANHNYSSDYHGIIIIELMKKSLTSSLTDTAASSSNLFLAIWSSVNKCNYRERIRYMEKKVFLSHADSLL